MHSIPSSDSTIPVRWGILSTAKIAIKFMKSIAESPNQSVLVVGSRSLGKAESFAATHHIAHAVSSYEEVLSFPGVNAVYIPLPPKFHLQWTEAAARAGKHVLCEKPIATSAEEARLMVQACTRSGVVFLDGTALLFNPRSIKLLDLFPKTGHIHQVSSSFTFSGPPEFFASNLRLDPDLEPNGCLGDLGWYNVRISNFSFRNHLPVSISGFGRLSERTTAIVHANVVVEYSGAVFASFDCGFDSVNRQHVEVSGSTGRIVVDDFVNEYELDCDGNPCHPRTFSLYEPTRHMTVLDPATVVPAPPTPFRIQRSMMIDAFSRLINLDHDQCPPLSDGSATLSAAFAHVFSAHSLLTQHLVSAATRSVRSGGRRLIFTGLQSPIVRSTFPVLVHAEDVLLRWSFALADSGQSSSSSSNVPTPTLDPAFVKSAWKRLIDSALVRFDAVIPATDCGNVGAEGSSIRFVVPIIAQDVNQIVTDNNASSNSVIRLPHLIPFVGESSASVIGTSMAALLLWISVNVPISWSGFLDVSETEVPIDLSSSIVVSFDGPPSVQTEVLAAIHSYISTL